MVCFLDKKPINWVLSNYYTQQLRDDALSMIDIINNQNNLIYKLFNWVAELEGVENQTTPAEEAICPKIGKEEEDEEPEQEDEE